MDILKSNPSGPLTETELENFEASLGYGLPSEYREFLLTHNGPLVEPISFWVTEGEGTGQIEGCFFGLHDGPTTNFKFWYLDNPSKFPAGCLPIAHDGMGNFTCIGLSGTERGRILFFDHESHWGESSLEDLEPVANSFDEFIGGLFHDEREDDEEEDDSSSNLFGELVLLWKLAKIKPSENDIFNQTQLFILLGEDKPCFEIESPHSRQFVDDLVAEATDAGPLEPSCRYGVASCSFVFANDEGAVLSVGVASKGHVICGNKYWKVGSEIWQTICDTAKAAALESGIDLNINE
ncbi:MAG: SMI1/KNR4 family protein [Luteolibacter sp.]